MASRRPISFRRLLTLQMGLLIVGALLLALAAVGALRRTSTEYGSAAAGYRELTRAYDVGAHVRSARTLLGAGQGAAAARELESAARRIAALGGDFGAGADEGQWHRLAGHVDRAAASPTTEAIDAAIRDLSQIADGVQHRITAIEGASDARQWRAIASLLAGAVLLAVAAAVVGALQYRTVAVPLERVRRAAASLSSRNMGARVPLAGPAELQALAMDFNRMAADLQELYRSLEAKVDSRTRQLLASARLASVGDLAAGVAHEINNPLSIITGFAERALRTPGLDAKTAETLKVVCEEAFRCKEITSKLLSLSRPEASDGARPAEPVHLANLCRDIVRHLSELPMSEGRTMEVTEDAPDISPPAREGELRQVVLNLLINALEATPKGGSVTLGVGRDEFHATLAVADTGGGIAPEDLARVFEPFFTRKRDSERPGLGLGLPLAQSIVESHGGTLVAASGEPNRGAVFTMTLPMLVDG